MSSLPSSSEEEFAGWGSTSLLHKERCCISLGIRFITASKQESCANHTGGIPTLSSTLSHKHARTQTQLMHKKAQSKQKLRELIQETKEYIKDVDTVWLLIIMHFKMTHYCVSGENGSRLPGVKQAYFFLFSHWTTEPFPLQRPGSQRSWACGSWPYSSGQRSSVLSEWKDTRGSIFEMASSDPGKKAPIRPVYRPI